MEGLDCTFNSAHVIFIMEVNSIVDFENKICFWKQIKVVYKFCQDGSKNYYYYLQPKKLSIAHTESPWYRWVG